MKTNDSIGARLRVVRKALSITQEEVAKALQLTRGAVGMVETGKAILTDRNVNRLLEVYPGINREYLETGQGSPLLPIGESPTPLEDAPKMTLQTLRKDYGREKIGRLGIPVVERPLLPGQKISDVMTEATEHESIPRLNGIADLKIIITDHAWDGTEYSYGRWIYAHEVNPWTANSWGVVHQVIYRGLPYTRSIQKHKDQVRFPESEYIVLRAYKENMDRYEDMDVKRSEIQFIGIAVADMGLGVGVIIRERAA